MVPVASVERLIDPKAISEPGPDPFYDMSFHQFRVIDLPTHHPPFGVVLRTSLILNPPEELGSAHGNSHIHVVPLSRWSRILTRAAGHPLQRKGPERADRPRARRDFLSTRKRPCNAHQNAGQHGGRRHGMDLAGDAGAGHTPVQPVIEVVEHIVDSMLFPLYAAITRSRGSKLTASR